MKVSTFVIYDFCNLLKVKLIKLYYGKCIYEKHVYDKHIMTFVTASFPSWF